MSKTWRQFILKHDFTCLIIKPTIIQEGKIVENSSDIKIFEEELIIFWILQLQNSQFKITKT